MNRNEVNVNTGGGSIIGAAIGSGNTVGENKIDISGSFNLKEKLDKSEILSVIAKLKNELEKVNDIDEDALDDIRLNLDLTIKAIDRPEPNKTRTLEKLKGVQSILESLKGSTKSAIALSKLVSELVSTIISSL